MPEVIIKLLFFLMLHGRVQLQIGSDPNITFPIDEYEQAYGTYVEQEESSQPAPVSVAVQSAPKSYAFYQDWERDAMGLCPHEQPNSAWKYVYFSPSIGVSALTYTSSDMHETVNVLWNDYRRNGTHRGMSHQFAFAWQMGYPYNYANGLTLYWVNWEDFAITYKNTVENAVLTEEYTSQHGATSQEATEYLRWLEDTYNSKCPNN